MMPIVVDDDGIDFSKTSEDTGTNGIYRVKSTADDMYPIYYYRGAVNNNLIFAGYCWKIVRTTDTGGLKLLYNGISTDGQCNNTGDSSQIGKKAFNDDINSLAYTGYMYSNVYIFRGKSMSSITSAYYYGNDVTYANGTYTLTNTISSNSWSSIYNGGLNNNHYTCFSTGKTCESINYIYFTNNNNAYYITLTNGEKIEDAITNMLGIAGSNSNNYNTTSSTIKGNKDTEGTLDWWYYNNIVLKGYVNYIEDTVWCNDRSIYNLGGFNPNGGSTTGDRIIFSNYNRFFNTKVPSLTCSRNIDKFTVDEGNGNGDLNYPVGLLTIDEMMLAGATANVSNTTYYLNNNSSYWSGLLFKVSDSRVFGSYVYSDSITDYTISSSHGVRPSISLKAGFSLIGNGNGTTTNPYIVG